MAVAAAFSCLTLSGAAIKTGNNTASNTDKPFVVPELKSWDGGKDSLTLGEGFRIAVPSSDPELLRIAALFAADWETMHGFRPQVLEGRGGKGDIILEIKADRQLKNNTEEGYGIIISDRVRLWAPETKGVFWGTQTLLQMAERQKADGESVDGQSMDQQKKDGQREDGQREGAQKEEMHLVDKEDVAGAITEPVTLPCGKILDWPDYGLRGFMMDCGRKYIPMSYLRDLVRIMAYYKMNTLQVHLNDNGFKQYFGNDWDRTYAAFRLECDTYPGLTARDGHYTKEEFIDFQEDAADIFVEIIPEIDVPAHSLALTRYMPEIGSQEYGMDHLDLFKSETYEFVDALFKEYLEGETPVFRGPKVHIGTDEYSNKDQAVVEKFRYFTDHYIRLVESYGKQAVVWGALTHADGETPVKSENVLMNAWYNGYADPKKMVEDGYRLISIPDGLVYIVPAAGYYYDYLNEQYLYENWTPAHVGDVVFPEQDPAIVGGMFAVWNDHAGNGISVKDIHHRLFPALQTLSAKMWSGTHTSLPYSEFDSLRHNIAEAPGINLSGRIGTAPACVLEMAEVAPNSTMPYPEIGYGYTVCLTIEGVKEEPGTELFRSENAVFYLSDPISGMMGFARDGYLNTFRYSIQDGDRLEVVIKGDDRSTELIINGTVIDHLEIEKRWYNEGKSVMYYVPTLVFPLEKSGDFHSRVTNLKVYNYQL